jgi:hypothetical protein
MGVKWPQPRDVRSHRKLEEPKRKGMLPKAP